MVCVAGCGTSGRATGENAIGGIVAQIVAADNAGDLDAVVALYTDDAVLLPPDGPPVRGRYAIRERYATAFNRVRFDVQATVEATRAEGSLGTAWGETRGRLMPRDDGEPTPLHDRFLMILEKGDADVWRIARLMWTPVGEVPTGVTEIERGLQRSVLLENERIRAVEISYAPGAVSPMHTHADPRTVYVLAGGRLELTPDRGTSTTIELVPGQMVWRPAERHVVRNVGTSTVRVLETEIITPR